MGKRRPASPYKFLDSYGLRDRRRFFGRELETDLLLADVVVSRLVVLFAKTGTGKTSLINAGVRPRLHERRYKTFLIRVREDPFASTRAALREQAPAAFPEAGSLADQVRELAKRAKRPIFLFFDQFEEFFLYTVPRDQAAAQEFVATIGDLHNAAKRWLSDGDFILEVHPFGDFVSGKTDADRSAPPTPSAASGRRSA